MLYFTMNDMPNLFRYKIYTYQERTLVNAIVQIQNREMILSIQRYRSYAGYPLV